jgi:hypothetical protein
MKITKIRKIFIIAVLIFCVVGGGASAQTQKNPRKISEMIDASQKTGNLMTGLLGGLENSNNAEITNLSAITFPNRVTVKYLSETRKIGKTRKKALEKWLKEYAGKSAGKKFYVNEMAVEEDGVRYWIMAHETAVLEKLKNTAAGDEIALNVRIFGYYRKGATTDHFLLAESLN